jgi:hypothetical protein
VTITEGGLLFSLFLFLHMRPLLFLLALATAASAATLQVTITNNAPAETLALAPVYSDSSFTLSDVVLTSAPAPGAVLPELDLSLAIAGSPAAFSAPGGSSLPTLQPGDSVSFLAAGPDFTSLVSLFYRIGLTGSQVASDPTGLLQPLSFTVTAGQALTYAPDGSPELPGTPSPSGVSLLSSAALFTVSSVPVPEPGSALLTMPLGLFGLIRRRRR